MAVAFTNGHRLLRLHQMVIRREHASSSDRPDIHRKSRILYRRKMSVCLSVWLSSVCLSVCHTPVLSSNGYT